MILVLTIYNVSVDTAFQQSYSDLTPQFFEPREIIGCTRVVFRNTGEHTDQPHLTFFFFVFFIFTITNLREKRMCASILDFVIKKIGKILSTFLTESVHISQGL